MYFGVLTADKSSAHQRYNDRAGACAAGQREVLNTAFISQFFHFVLADYPTEVYIRALRKRTVCPQLASKLAQRLLRHRAVAIQQHDRVRQSGIAKLQIVALHSLAVYLCGYVLRKLRNIVQTYGVHPLISALSDDQSGRRLHTLRLACQPLFITVSGDTARAVAAHFSEAAVRIIKIHAVIAAVLRRVHDHHTIRTDRHAPCAQPSGQRRKLRLR